MDKRGKRSTHVAGLYEHSPRFSCHSLHLSGGVATCTWTCQKTALMLGQLTYSDRPGMRFSSGTVHLVSKPFDVIEAIAYDYPLWA